MTNDRLSCAAVRSLAFGIAALVFTGCTPTGSDTGTGGSGGSSSGSAGGGGSAGAGSGGGSGATGTGGGTAGTGGVTGSAGTTGTAGTTGIAGTSGSAGTSGTAGTAGSAGSTGTAGTTGAAGRGGTTGTAGTTGAAGRGGTTGTAGATGTAGRGGTTGSGGSAGAGTCQHGQVAGNEVLIVGDSYFPAAGSEIPNELRRLAGGAAYRDVSVGGTKMAAIAASYTRNKNPPPKVVIMDGGGNDILQNPGCSPGCAEEVQAVTDARNFFKTMATDGSVEAVVFIFYYDMPVIKAGLDWMRPKMAAECAASPVPCFFADNQPLFAGMDASAYTTDGIHPNKAAADKIAKQVWDIMVANCIAQ